jgi:ABC-2 type transport system permease protein
MNTAAAFRKEILEQWRTRRFLVTVAVLVVFGMLSPMIAKMMPEIFKMVPGTGSYAALMPQPTMKDAVDQYVKNISQFALIVGILMAMGSVVQEKERGTAAMILSKPLSRWTFILSKLTSLFVVFAVSILAAGFGAYYYTLFLFGPMPLLPWLTLNGLLLVYAMVYVALTLFFSTLSRSQALAGGLSLTALALLGVMGSIPHLGIYLPAQLATWGVALMMKTDFSAMPALWCSFGIIMAALIGSWLVLLRQEL